MASASSWVESAWSSTDKREAHRDEMDRAIPPRIAFAAAAKEWARQRRVQIWGTGICFASFKNFGKGHDKTTVSTSNWVEVPLMFSGLNDEAYCGS